MPNFQYFPRPNSTGGGGEGESFNWRGPWSAEDTYEENDVVEHEGSSYICILESTGNEPPNGTYWELMAAAGEDGMNGSNGAPGADGQGFTWRGPWDIGTAYVAYDVIEHDGSSYNCILANTGEEPPNGTYWELVAAKGDTGSAGADGTSFIWRGAWDSGTAYVENDVVENDGSAYICTDAHTNQEPPNVTYWDLFVSKGDTGSQGIQGDPGAAGDDGQGFNWTGPWSGATAYVEYDVVEEDGSSYNCILAHTNQQPPNPTYWELMAAKGDTGATGADGRHGGAVTIEYTFSTTTTNADPGNGILRLDNATQNAATAIRADLLDRLGTTWTTVIDSLDDSTSTIKGHIRLVKRTDASAWLLFTVSAVDASSGYRNITVTNVGSSGANPFADTDEIVLFFTRQGDKGDTGATGAPGSLTPTGVQSSDYTASNGDLVVCSVSGGSFTVTMPASPSNGHTVAVILITVHSTNYNGVAIAPNSGQTLEAQDLVSGQVILSKQYDTVTFVYKSSTSAWEVVNDSRAQSLAIKSVSANYTVRPWEFVWVDASAASRTITLPSSPLPPNTRVGVGLSATASNRTVTILNDFIGSPTLIGKNGSEGSSTLLFIAGDYVELQYLGSDDWLIAVDGRAPHVCQVSRTGTAQSFDGTTEEQFNIDTIEFETTGMGSASTDDITIRRAGRYHLMANCQLVSNLNQMTIQIRVGSTVVIECGRDVNQVDNFATLNAATVWSLAAGDVISGYINNGESGGISNITSTRGRPRLSVAEIR